MRIILSPAKQMVVNSDDLAPEALPEFLDAAEEIKAWLQTLSYEEAKKLWKCNDKLATENYERLQTMDLQRGLTPAILAYDGIAFKYMAPSVFEYDQFDYVQEHLRILSGLYGVLKPCDGVIPYRLEMQAKAKVADTRDLYSYWGMRIYDAVQDDSHVIINLASREYSRCVEKYLQPEDRFITCVFGELSGDKVVQKGVYAKMARGEMVRYMAVNRIEDPEDMKDFNLLGYEYREDLSTETEYTFIK